MKRQAIDMVNNTAYNNFEYGIYRIVATNADIYLKQSDYQGFINVRTITPLTTSEITLCENDSIKAVFTSGNCSIQRRD